MTDPKFNALTLYAGWSMPLRGLPTIAVVLALTLALVSPHAYADSSLASGSTDEAGSVSQNIPKVDNPVPAKICPRCGGAKADSPRCRNCGLILRTSPGRFIPYGLNGKTTYSLNAIRRSNQSINRSGRSLQKSLRDMNTSINRIRMHNRRF
jgi:hypothetical protein